MSQSSTTSANSLRQLCRKTWFRVCSGLAVLIAVFVFLFPIGAGYFAGQWLMKNGADKAAINRITLNPFTGTASVIGIDVLKNGKVVLHNSSIFVNLSLKAVFRKQIILQQIRIEDVSVDIELQENGNLRIGSYTIVKQEKPEEKIQEIEKSIPWIVRLTETTLSNVTILYKQPDLTAHLVIRESKLVKFNTDPNDREGALVFNGSLNGSPITLDLPTLSIAPDVMVRGTVKIGDLHLDDLADLLQPYLKPFSGVAAVDGVVQFSMKSSMDMEVDFDGKLNVDQVDIVGKGWGTKGSVAWDGRVLYGSDHKTGMIIDVDGELHGQNIFFAMPDISLGVEDPAVTIKGKTIVKIGDEVTVDSASQFTLNKTAFTLGSLSVDNGQSGWQGSIFFGSGTDTQPLQVRVDGNLSVDDLKYAQVVNKAKMSVANKSVNFDGAVDYIHRLSDKQPLTVGVDGTIRATGLQFIMPDLFKLDQQQLAVHGATGLKIGQELTVSYDGSVGLDETSFSMADMQISSAKMTWQGKNDVKISQGFATSLNGNLALHKTAFTMADLKAATGNLSWQGKAGYSMDNDNGQLIKMYGSLQADKITSMLPGGEMEISQEQIRIDNGFSLQIADQLSFSGKAGATADGFLLASQGVPMLALQKVSIVNLVDNDSVGFVVEKVGLENIHILSSENQPYAVDIPLIVASTIAGDLIRGTVQELRVNNPVVRDDSKNIVLAALDSITVHGIAGDKQPFVSAQKATIFNAVFFEQQGEDTKPPMLTLGGMEADNLNWSLTDGFSGDTIALNSISSYFTKEKQIDNDVASIPLTEVNNDTPTTTETEPDKDKSPVPVRLKQLTITGNSGFQFTDNSLTTSFTTTLGINSLQVDDIDFSRPEKPFTFQLKGTFDEHAPLEITGSCAPFADKMFFEQKLHLRNYSLYAVSPYVIDAIGTMFESGQMNLISDLKITGGQLEANNNVVFKDIKAKTVHNELANKLNSKLPISLDMSLSLLRDNHGDIDLDVPLSGDLSDLSVGLTDILITSMSTALITAVTPYLAYTVLGPTGALAYLGLKVGQALLTTNLPALEYEAGITALTEEQEELLDSIGKTIKDDAEQDYSICARVSVYELSGIDREVNENVDETGDTARDDLEDSDDFGNEMAGGKGSSSAKTEKTRGKLANNPELRKELCELGTQRAGIVKSLFQDEFGINEDRLLICSPSPNFTEDGISTINFKK